MARYRKIDPRIWNDKKFRTLTDDGQLAFLFLLSHPFMTSVGAMRGTVAGLAAEKKWTTERMESALRESASLGMIEIDDDALFISLVNFLKYNEPEGPNSVGAWADAIDLIPECDAKKRAYARSIKYLASRSRKFIDHVREQAGGILDAIMDASGDAISDAIRHAISDGSGEGCPIPDPEPEQEQEEEGNARARARTGARAPETPTPVSPAASARKSEPDPEPETEDVPTPETPADVLRQWTEAAADAKKVPGKCSKRDLAECLKLCPDPTDREKAFTLIFDQPEPPAFNLVVLDLSKWVERARKKWPETDFFEDDPEPPEPVPREPVVSRAVAEANTEKLKSIVGGIGSNRERPKQSASEAIDSLKRSAS